MMTPVLRRTVASLLLGLGLGVLVAVLLERVLDQAVREETRHDLAAALARVGDEFAPDLAARRGVHEKVSLAARQLGARVTLIAADGTVVSDSDVDAERLPHVENHGRRPEVLAALRDGTGFGERNSATVQEPFLYVAHRVGPGEKPVGYVRLAMRETDLRALERPFRGAAERIALTTGILVGLLVLLIRQRHAGELSRIREGLAEAAEGRRPAFVPGSSEESQEVHDALSRFARLVAAERAGSERERVLARIVFTEVPAGLVVVDERLNVLDANPAARRLFGAPAEVPLAGLVDLVRNLQAVTLFSNGVGRSPADPPSAQTVRVDGRDGERLLELTVRAVPHTGQAGEPAAVGVVRDVTETERTETMRRRFVADVSHELRTPIAAIRAAAEALAPERYLPPDLLRLVDIVLRQSTEMQELVSDLMDLSQLESGAVTLQRDRVALEPLIADVVQSLAPAARERDVAVDVTVPKGLAILGDRRRLAQVLRNLVDNAIKFSPKGARVDVLAATSGESRALVHVVDRGIGIPREEQANIFQRFYRVDPSRAKTVPGTGLGLAIVKHLLILHGGAIGVDSEPGRGSRFTVTLPVAASVGELVKESP